jgi:glutaminase
VCAGEVLSLNTEKKPHNGLTSAGALKLASLLYAGQDAPSRIAQLLQSFAAFAGVPHLSCSMSAYLSLRASSNKYALRCPLRKQRRVMWTQPDQRCQQQQQQRLCDGLLA